MAVYNGQFTSEVEPTICFLWIREDSINPASIDRVVEQVEDHGSAGRILVLEGVLNVAGQLTHRFLGDLPAAHRQVHNLRVDGLEGICQPTGVAAAPYNQTLTPVNLWGSKESVHNWLRVQLQSKLEVKLLQHG